MIQKYSWKQFCNEVILRTGVLQRIAFSCINVLRDSKRTSRDLEVCIQYNAMCKQKAELNISHEYYGRARTRSDLLPRTYVRTYVFLKCCTEWPQQRRIATEMRFSNPTWEIYDTALTKLTTVRGTRVFSPEYLL